MAANVEHDFSNFFEMDEEKIRRIYSILRKRIPEDIPGAVKFKITRNDNLIYSTENIDDIIAEPNDSTTKINKVEISHAGDPLSLTITFSKKDGSSIKISGEDRDNVFLLYSELKDYITKEVTNIRSFSWLQVKFIMPFIILAFIAYMSYFLWSIKPISQEVINKAISSNDINEKLNYLIKYKNIDPISPPLQPLFFFMAIVTLAPILPLTKVYDYLRPKNIFLFGKEIQVIRSRRKTSSNIFWVVLVGGAISLALTYFTPKIFG